MVGKLIKMQHNVHWTNLCFEDNTYVLISRIIVVQNYQKQEFLQFVKDFWRIFVVDIAKKLLNIWQRLE